jgi:hypothetical protein
MTLATVPLEALTDRVNKRLGTSYKPNTVSTARSQGVGHPGLLYAIRQETAAMLQEAADQAKAQAAEAQQQVG